MERPQKVAQSSIEGLLNEEMEVMLGGEKQETMIQINLENPLKVDEKNKRSV